jgi:hypothetical protein
MTIDNLAKILHVALILVSVLFYALPKRARKPSIRRADPTPPGPR